MSPRLRHHVFCVISVPHVHKHHLLISLFPVKDADALNAESPDLYAPTLSLVFAISSSSAIEKENHYLLLRFRTVECSI